MGTSPGTPRVPQADPPGQQGAAPRQTRFCTVCLCTTLNLAAQRPFPFAPAPVLQVDDILGDQPELKEKVFTVLKQYAAERKVECLASALCMVLKQESHQQLIDSIRYGLPGAPVLPRLWLTPGVCLSVTSSTAQQHSLPAGWGHPWLPGHPHPCREQCPPSHQLHPPRGTWLIFLDVISN